MFAIIHKLYYNLCDWDVWEAVPYGCKGNVVFIFIRAITETLPMYQFQIWSAATLNCYLLIVLPLRTYKKTPKLLRALELMILCITI